MADPKKMKSNTTGVGEEASSDDETTQVTKERNESWANRLARLRALVRELRDHFKEETSVREARLDENLVNLVPESLTAVQEALESAQEEPDDDVWAVGKAWTSVGAEWFLPSEQLFPRREIWAEELELFLPGRMLLQRVKSQAEEWEGRGGDWEGRFGRRGFMHFLDSMGGEKRANWRAKRYARVRAKGCRKLLTELPDLLYFSFMANEVSVIDVEAVLSKEAQRVASSADVALRQDLLPEILANVVVVWGKEFSLVIRPSVINGAAIEPEAARSMLVRHVRSLEQINDIISNNYAGGNERLNEDLQSARRDLRVIAQETFSALARAGDIAGIGEAGSEPSWLAYVWAAIQESDIQLKALWLRHSAYLCGLASSTIMQLIHYDTAYLETLNPDDTDDTDDTMERIYGPTIEAVRAGAAARRPRVADGTRAAEVLDRVLKVERLPLLPPDVSLEVTRFLVVTAVQGLWDTVLDQGSSGGKRLSEALLAHFVDGKTQTAVGKELGLSAATVNRRIAEGMGLLWDGLPSEPTVQFPHDKNELFDKALLESTGQARINERGRQEWSDTKRREERVAALAGRNASEAWHEMMSRGQTARFLEPEQRALARRNGQRSAERRWGKRRGEPQEKESDQQQIG